MSYIAAIGVFDGVHRGHRFLLGQLCNEAQARGISPLVITFEKSPAAVISPESAPKMLTDDTRRLELLRQFPADLFVLDFNRVRPLTAGGFLAWLSREAGVRVLMAGYDTCFGSDRLGGDALRQAAEETGVEVVFAPEFPAERVSSTLVRLRVSQGDIEAANTLLGREYALSGPVVKGRQLGRTIGFPTANVDVAECMSVPMPGVYAARALGRPAIVNIGTRPTVEAHGQQSVEAHIIGYDGDLYGQTVELRFVKRLRSEKRFDSLDALKQQITDDKEQCLKIMTR